MTLGGPLLLGTGTELVHTAFPGTHQEGGTRAVIRVRSQSAEGGVACLPRTRHGVGTGPSAGVRAVPSAVNRAVAR
ncbi:hypothetical protein [Streptomyces sp. NPDC048192]|jgi:hypothetical protein|uniref:hypothetical protein n=1 Tax=unclassified Streptomyces TaxID=2593676 RepID=UPI00371B8380